MKFRNIFIACLIILNINILIADEAADRGKVLYTTKACSACHSLDGSKLVGPSFKGLYGKKGEHNEGTYVADDAYLTESILKPNAKIVKGYAPAMPAMPLTDTEVNDIISFIKTLK